MPSFHLPRLASVGPAHALPGEAGLDALGSPDGLDPTAVLGSLRSAVLGASSALTARRQGFWDDVRHAFPRPGHAQAAVGMALASATLASLGVLALVVAPDTPAAAPVAGHSASAVVPLDGGDPALVLGVVDPALAGAPAVDPALAAAPQVEAPPAPAPPVAAPQVEAPPAAAPPVEAPATEAPATEAPAAEATPPSGPGHEGPDRTEHSPPTAASGVPTLSRVSRAESPAPAAHPAPGVATPELAPDLPGVPRLHRLSRAQVLASTPFPALALPSDEAGAAPVPAVPTDAGALPLGTGMWLYLPEEIEGGSVDALVARARQVGLTHVYVRTGSSRSGFYAQPYMDELLPKAHAAGIRVYGWDFPYLENVDDDVNRAMAAITYTTPSGERLDGFAADIETASEGTNLSAQGAAAYGQGLRQAAGSAYPLVAVVPRPSPQMQARYPYAAVIPPFDAVAPMTYWLNRQPDSDVTNDVTFLSSFGKPVLPIGQAYDGAPEGGRPGSPPPEEIQRFLASAHQVGASGVSFWSWQHANQAIWDTLQAAPEFRWETGAPGELRADQVRGLQAQLTRFGYPVPLTGAWDDLTTGALRSYQERAGLPASGILDDATLAVLMEPFNPPVAGLVGVAHARTDLARLVSDSTVQDGGDADIDIDLGPIQIDLPFG